MQIYVGIVHSLGQMNYWTVSFQTLSILKCCVFFLVTVVQPPPIIQGGHPYPHAPGTFTHNSSIADLEMRFDKMYKYLISIILCNPDFRTPNSSLVAKQRSCFWAQSNELGWWLGWWLNSCKFHKKDEHGNSIYLFSTLGVPLTPETAAVPRPISEAGVQQVLANLPPSEAE